MSKYIFRAVTSEGYILKFISELLKSTLKTNGKFFINREKILLRQTDDDEHLLVEIELFGREFDGGYEFNNDSDMFKGINLAKFQTAFKGIKKKDKVELFITAEEPERLSIQILSSDKRETTNVNIFKIPKRYEKAIEVYEFPKNIPSSDFQKIIKKLSGMTKDKITVQIQGSKYVSFSADGGLIIDSKTEFGDLDESEEHFHKEFFISDMKKIVKMSGMSKNIKVYKPEVPDYPIKIETRAGSLGTCGVYIKTCEYIETDEGIKAQSK